jgi:hypothetical protein
VRAGAIRPYDAWFVPDRRAYSDAEIEAAVQALSEPGRLEQAERVIAHAAPDLQRILDEALRAADWFGSAHDSQVRQAVDTANPDARMEAVQQLLTEETRVSMLVGVAVGYELGHLLMEQTHRED